MTDIYDAEIYLRRATAQEWIDSNIILHAGEVGFESQGEGVADKGKIGDGVTRWVDLPYSLGVSDAGHGYTGWSLTLNKFVDTTDLQESVDVLMDIGYTPASIALSASPSQSVRENGDTITSVGLSAITTKRADDITAVTFYRDNSLIYTVPSPQIDGGTETYTDGTDFSTTTNFTAKVNDGTTLSTSNTVSFVFVYPYYYGVGAAGLTPAQVAALTKDIIVRTTSKTVSFSPANQKIYFAYPLAHGALTSILDANGFEILNLFTRTTGTITGLDSTSQSYYIYESNSLATVSGFNITFKL